MVAPALDAAEALAAEGINARVLDMHTVKPIDRDALLAAAERDRRPGRGRGAPGPRRPRQRGRHGRRRAAPGADPLRQPRRPVRRERRPDALIEKYGLTAENVVEAAKAAIGAKSR